MSYFIKGNKERGEEAIKLLEDKGGENFFGMNGKEFDGYYYIEVTSGCIKHTETPTFIRNLFRFCEELTLPEKWIPEFKIGEEVDYINSDGTIANTGKVIDYLYDSRHYVIKCKDGEAYWYEKFVSLHKWVPKFKIGDFVKSTTNAEPGDIVDIDYSTENYRIHIYGGYFWTNEETLTYAWTPKFKVGDTFELTPNFDITDRTIGTIKNININCKYYDVLTNNGITYHWTEDKLKLCDWKPQRGETVLVRDFDESKWDEGIFSYYDNDEDKFVLQGGVMYDHCIPFDINKLGKVTNEYNN